MHKLYSLLMVVCCTYSFSQTLTDLVESAESKIKNGDFKSAVVDFQKALEADNPENTDYILDRLSYCHYELSEFDRALEYIDRSLVLDPKSVSSRLTRARIFSK